MAAGEGTRMRSSTPKMLHPVCGRPMVAWPILAAREAGAGRVAAILSPNQDVAAGLPDEVETVTQPQPDGTGGAVRAALSLVEEAETVLVLSGDVPLISPETISGLLAAHAESGAAATMLTIELDDPGSYGRVVRAESGEEGRTPRGLIAFGAPKLPPSAPLGARGVRPRPTAGGGPTGCAPGRPALRETCSRPGSGRA